MKRISLLILLSCLTFDTFACICWFSTDKRPVKEKIREADMILYATAVTGNLVETTTGDSSMYVTEITFNVLKTWKGQKAETIKFKAKQYPCEDANFIIGERYIIFAYINKKTGELETNNCSCLREDRYNKFVPEWKKRFVSTKDLIDRKTKK